MLPAMRYVSNFDNRNHSPALYMDLLEGKRREGLLKWFVLLLISVY